MFKMKLLKNHDLMFIYTIVLSVLFTYSFILIQDYGVSKIIVGKVLNEISESNDFQNDISVNKIVDVCNNSSFSDEQKVKCVNEQFSKKYMFQTRNEANVLVPVVMFKNGGMCKDSAAFYNVVFKKLNLTNNFVVLKNHVFNIVEIQTGYCIVDQNIIECIKVT